MPDTSVATPFVHRVVEGLDASADVPPRDARVAYGAAGARWGWLVTNGRAVVGPVSLEVLLRGIAEGAVGPDCLLRQPTWAAWRRLRQVREVRAWFQGAAPSGHEPRHWLDRAGDRGELVHCALLAGMVATGATWGAGYGRRGGRWYRTCVVGGAASTLGQRIRDLDPVFPWVEAGAVYLGAPGPEVPLGRALCGHLGPGSDLRGVAVVPLRDVGRPLGWLELGRRDHPFRRDDAGLLARLALEVRVRLG